MIDVASVDIHRYTVTKNTQGIVAKTFKYLKTKNVNIQPKSLNEVQAQMWGVNAQNAKTKWLGYDDEDAQVQELQRVYYLGEWYEIRGLNVWPSHTECILIPVSGIAEDVFCLSTDIEPIPGHSYSWLDASEWFDDSVWFD